MLQRSQDMETIWRDQQQQQQQQQQNKMEKIRKEQWHKLS